MEETELDLRRLLPILIKLLPVYHTAKDMVFCIRTCLKNVVQISSVAIGLEIGI